jgi:membrane fusion protein (multidrug efflux system)
LGRRTVLYGGLGLLVAAGLVFAVQTIFFYLHHVETDDAQIEGHIDPVLARVAGYVADVMVSENQRVAAGQVLVRVDPRDFQSKVNQAQAALTSAQAAVAVARANVEASKSRREKTSTDLTRAATLFQQHVISPQEHDAARAAADAAEAEYQAAVRQVIAAEAQVAQRQADLDYAQLQLSYTTVVASAPGFVSKKSVEVGQFIEASQPLMAVVRDGDVWVVANFKETQLRKMRVGQAVTVKVDAYPGEVFSARVESIGFATGAKFALLPPDNATGNFVKVVQRIPIKIVLIGDPDPNHPLRVGMNVTAIVNVG